MIKWVQLAGVAKNKPDFDLLVRLLDSLGVRKGFGGVDGTARWQEFLPLVFRLDLLRPEGPREDADLSLVISDPDSAAVIVRKLGLDVTEDRSGPEPTQDYRNLRVQLPGGAKVLLIGHRPRSTSCDSSDLEGKLDARGKRFAVVVSRFNSFITERLLQGTLDGLVRCGANGLRDIRVARVPGAFEIPSAARTLAETKKYDAIICLGCLLRGDTAHYDVIVNEVTRGIGQSAQETGVPHAFGVLTCENLEQAIDRAGLKMGNKGFEAALAAVEMAALKRSSSALSWSAGQQELSFEESCQEETKALTRSYSPTLPSVDFDQRLPHPIGHIPVN